MRITCSTRWHIIAMAAAVTGCGARDSAPTPTPSPSRAAAALPGDGDRQGDANAADTRYAATADVPCSGVGAARGVCPAGVLRAADQIAVEIALPKGGTRSVLFDGKGKFVTVSTAEADGSAAYRITASRDSDWTVVKAGPEEYRIPDAFVLGD